MTAQTVSNAVATREAGIVSVMWQRRTHFAAVLPDHVDVKSFLGTAAAALYGNADLMTAAETSPDSLITAMMRCAALGHQPGTDEFYLTPRRDHGRPKVLGIEGYRGVVERMYRSGAVLKVVVREVCANDPFTFIEGEMDIPVHDRGDKPGATTGAQFFGANGSRRRGEMVGVYAYARLLGGAYSQVVTLDRDDVHAARDAGGYKPDDKYTPWNRLDAGGAPPEFKGRSMWWKTAARRLEPWVPTSAEFRREQLRAAVQAAGPAAQPPTAAVVTPEPPVDAELVEEPYTEPSPTPAPPAGASEPTSGLANGQPARSAPGPSKAAMAKLEDLFKRIPLGEAKDRAVFVAWVTGHPAAETLTAADVRALTTILEDAEAAAEGDVAEAASQLWQQHKRAAEAHGA